MYYAKSLHKINDQSFQWKFTITVVETLADIIEQNAGKFLKFSSHTLQW